MLGKAKNSPTFLDQIMLENLERIKEQADIGAELERRVKFLKNLEYIQKNYSPNTQYESFFQYLANFSEDDFPVQEGLAQPQTLGDAEKIFLKRIEIDISILHI